MCTWTWHILANVHPHALLHGHMIVQGRLYALQEWSVPFRAYQCFRSSLRFLKAMNDSRVCCRGKAWGVRMDLAKRKVQEATVPMPLLLKQLADRMRSLPILAKFHPNEANAIDYHRARGNCLKPHVDDRLAVWSQALLAHRFATAFPACADCLQLLPRMDHWRDSRKDNDVRYCPETIADHITAERSTVNLSICGQHKSQRDQHD